MIPAGVTRGKTTRVTCYGKGLAQAKTLWTTFPAKIVPVSEPAPSDTSVSFDVAVPKDANVGIFGARIVTDSNLSDLRLTVVDDLPVAIKKAPNQTIEQAQKVTLPVSVGGVVGAEQSDFYAITVAKGQRVAFEAVASRFGRDFDPLVILRTKAGKQIVSHDNSEGLDFDVRFDHVFEEAGEYLVELRDTRYQGNATFNYHLRMGDFPIGRVAYPAGGQRGRWVSVAFPGRAATDVAPLSTEVSTDPFLEVVNVIAKGKQGSSWVPFLIDDREQQLELEPNESIEQGNAFEPPHTLNGRLQEKGDIDCFRFAAKKGQQVVFDAETRELSSPADLYLRILDPAGKQLAVVDDTGSQDGRLAFSAPADGVYALMVEDLHRRGGPGFIYRITTAAPLPDFSLRSGMERLEIPRGSATPVLVSAARAGYPGAIELTIAGSTDGLTCSGTPIPANAASEALTIAATAEAPLGVGTIRIVGTGKQGERSLTHAAGIGALLTPKLNNLTRVPANVLQEIPVLVTPRAFFTLAAKVDAPAVARYAKTPLTITASRDKFFAEPITVAVGNLPANVAVAVKPIDKEKNSVRLEFDSKAKTPLGRFPILVSGTSKFGDRTAQVFAKVLYVDVRPAFALTLSAAEATIEAGAKRKLTVKAERLPAYAGPIDVTLQNLPKGITAAAVKIAEKQTEATVELAAAADAPVASIANLTATGTAKVGGQNESVVSPAIKLAVVGKKPAAGK